MDYKRIDNMALVEYFKYKKIKFASKKFIIGMLDILAICSIMVGCNNVEDEKIVPVNKIQNEKVSPDAMDIEDMILNYLPGNWVDYEDRNYKMSFIVKSVNEVYWYLPNYVTEVEVLEFAKKGEWSKEKLTITDTGFEIDSSNDSEIEIIDKYLFDFSKVVNDDISNIILHKQVYVNGELLVAIDYVRPGKEYVQPEPSIGMSREEVKASTWGEPNDINKTTYEWGTIEQWCYYDNKYIYFENGEVTAISE